MKKLLVILAAMLALCLCFTACNNVGGGDDPKDPPAQATPEAMQAIKDMFAGNETVGDLFEGIETEIKDYEEIYAEICKQSLEAKLNTSLTMEGETGNINGYLGFKDGNAVAKLEAVAPNGDTANIGDVYAFLTEDGNFVLVTGANGQYSGQMLDMEDALEEIEDALVNADSAEMNSYVGMLNKFKLPEMKDSDIEFKDGKYIISKAYWKSVVNYTLDVYVDSMMEGAPADQKSEIQAQADEYKTMAAGIIDAVDFELFFRVDGSEIVGFGMDASLNKESLAAIGEIIGEEMDDDFESFAISFDIKGRGDNIEYVDFSLNVNADGDKIAADVRLDSIIDSEGKMAGFKMTEKVEVSSSYVIGDPSYQGEKEHVQNTKVAAEVILDLTKYDTFGADVFKADIDVTVTDNNVPDVQISIDAGVSSRGEGEYAFNFSFADKKDAENNVSATGTLEYNETAADFPEIPDAVIDAKDYAIENEVTFGAGSAEEDILPNEKVETHPDYT